MLLPLPSACYNMFSIEMINPNYMTHLDHVVRIIITWSEWRESNPIQNGCFQYVQRFCVQNCVHIGFMFKIRPSSFRQRLR